MPLPNHTLAYRPLIAGVCVYNPLINEPGTLGFIGTSNGTDRWIVSCYHVLARDPRAPSTLPLTNGESIFQGSAHDGVVAVTDVTKADPAGDCAAARVLAGQQATGAVLGIGAVAPVVPPTPGMAVLKCGIETGITEGVIVKVDAGRVLIGPLPGFPRGYALGGKGDSGALWMTKDTHAAVALHLGIRTLDGVAVATPVDAVLASLQLTIA
jgi:hypothetical protein